jgi:hypothetical protein
MWSLWKSTYRKLQSCGLCGGAHTANYKGVVSVEKHIPQTTKAWSLWRGTYRKLQRRGLCGGAHTANYKGCEYYHNLTRSRNAAQKPQLLNGKYSVASFCQPVTPPLNTQPITPPLVTRTYADITRRGTDNQDIT